MKRGLFLFKLNKATKGHNTHDLETFSTTIEDGILWPRDRKCTSLWILGLVVYCLFTSYLIGYFLITFIFLQLLILEEPFHLLTIAFYFQVIKGK